MNWLAHLHLARPIPLERIGQLAGDFVRGPLEDRFDPTLRRGIAEHRALDAWIDDQDAHRRSRERMPEGFRRYGGIAVDLIVDHVLARDWERFRPDATLEAFADSVDRDLLAHLELLPERLADTTRRLAIAPLLVGYRELEGLERALYRVGRRLRREVPLEQVVDAFVAEEAAFTADAHEMLEISGHWLGQQRA